VIDVIFDGKNRRSIGAAETLSDAMKLVSSFLQEAERKSGFHSYYTRCAWHDDQCMLWLDVGSWSEFFELRFDSPEAYREAKKCQSVSTGL